MSNKLFEQSKFKFVGSLITGKELVTHCKSEKSAWIVTRLNAGIKDDANSQFLSIDYMHKDGDDTCKIYTENNGMKEFPLADTDKEYVLNEAADFTKITIDLETDFEKKKEYMKLFYRIRACRNENSKILNQENISIDDKEKVKKNEEKIATLTREFNEQAVNRVQFCHMKDVVLFLEQTAPALKGLKLKVTGNVKCNYHNGQNRLKYIPSLIEVVPDETPNEISMIADIFFDKDSMKEDKKAKKIYVDGYIGERVKQKDTLYGIQVVINYERIDETNTQHLDLLAFMKDTFTARAKKMVYKNQIEIDIINGSEKVEFNESCLTEQQKQAIRLGVATLESFRPKGNIYGERKQELRVARPTLKGNYGSGAIEAMTISELDKYLVSDDSDINESEISGKTSTEATNTSQETHSDSLIKSLFGK